ncbi:hypothetical protein Bbelb_445890 [Branchiostoma belcheri]|nr:hypothetical protein Bbelb_445890 [Branchiostoma belcheri]
MAVMMEELPGLQFTTFPRVSLFLAHVSATAALAGALCFSCGAANAGCGWAACCLPQRPAVQLPQHLSCRTDFNHFCKSDRSCIRDLRDGEGPSEGSQMGSAGLASRGGPLAGQTNIKGHALLAHMQEIDSSTIEWDFSLSKEMFPGGVLRPRWAHAYRVFVGGFDMTQAESIPMSGHVYRGALQPTPSRQGLYPGTVMGDRILLQVLTLHTTGTCKESPTLKMPGMFPSQTLPATGRHGDMEGK